LRKTAAEKVKSWVPSRLIDNYRFLAYLSPPGGKAMSVQTDDKYTLLQNARQVVRKLSAEELQAVLNFIKVLALL
jgi:hypothetical protein